MRKREKFVRKKRHNLVGCPSSIIFISVFDLVTAINSTSAWKSNGTEAKGSISSELPSTKAWEELFNG